MSLFSVNMTFPFKNVSYTLCLIILGNDNVSLAFFNLSRGLYFVCHICAAACNCKIVSDHDLL